MLKLINSFLNSVLDIQTNRKMEYLGNSNEENRELYNINSFGYYALLFSDNEKVQNFNLERFMNYKHTHVSMDDWGLQCNIEVNNGYIYVVRRPATDIAKAFYISDKDFNSNMKIMKKYFVLTEKCILMNIALFTYLSEDEQKTLVHNNRIEYNYHQKITCPLCRTQTTGDSILTVYGLENKCAVCLTNNADIYLKKCKHACICNSCCGKLVHQ